jgi:cell division septum initiation protein DivIVA
MRAEIPVVLLLSLLISACGSSRPDFETLQRDVERLKQENQALQNEANSLLQENKKLKTDLELFHYEPQRLLADVQTSLKNRQFAEAKAAVETLSLKYPISCEASQAQNLLEQANQMMTADTAGTETKNRQVNEVDRKRIAAATSKMRITVDPTNDTTWYEDKNTPQNDNVFKVYLAISVEKDKPPRLHFAAQSVAKNGLNIDSFTIHADGKKFDSGLMKFERGGLGAGYVWEYVDMLVDSKEIEWIRAIISSKKTIIQYHGEQSDVNREIMPVQKISIQNVLDAFVALGGTLPQ